MTQVSQALSSRFYQRWLAADPQSGEAHYALARHSKRSGRIEQPLNIRR